MKTTVSRPAHRCYPKIAPKAILRSAHDADAGSSSGAALIIHKYAFIISLDDLVQRPRSLQKDLNWSFLKCHSERAQRATNPCILVCNA